MDNNRNQAQNKERFNLIHAVQTPLGFFALVVLIAEGILLALLPFLTGAIQSVVVVSMVILIFILVFTVAGMAVFRPSALRGKDHRAGLPGAPKDLREGDKVFIKKPIKKDVIIGNEKGVILWNKEMDSHVGEITHIRSLNKKTKIARLEIDGGKNEWSIDWLYW